MNRVFFLYFILLGGLSSCYWYDGPTRPKRELPKPKPYVVPVRKSLSAQEYLEKMAGDIQRKIPSAQVQILEDSIKVLFPDNIKYNQSAILPLENINSEIKKLAGLIRQYEKTNVLITGHTDKSGNERNNKKISEMRAKYILELLMAYKAPANRLNSWGLGSSNPLSNNADRNRRVEFVVLSTIVDDEDS